MAPDKRDWLYAPVLAGMCRAESLKDGTLDLADIAEMNDMLAIRAENQFRANEASARAAKKK